jgi:hypothetical protein
MHESAKEEKFSSFSFGVKNQKVEFLEFWKSGIFGRLDCLLGKVLH